MSSAIKFLKSQPALQPLAAVVGIGCVFAGGYVLRLSTMSYDASWKRSSNPHPWQKVPANQNIHFLGHQDKEASKKVTSEADDIRYKFQ